MGVIGTAETGTECTAGTEGTAETGVVEIAETGVMGVAGVVAEGIPKSAATPSPSKVSAKHKNRHTNKGRL